MPPAPPLPEPLLRRPIAHRGLHDLAAGRPENSLAAAEAAIAAGYAIELDLQRAACGEAMVFHDAALGRLTGEPGLVADYPAARLATFRLLGTGETIPTLPAFLARVAGRVPLLLEVKDQDGHLGPEVGPLEARVADCLATYRGVAAVMSFNPHSVAALAAAAPDLPRGLTTCDFEGADWALPDYRRAELAGIGDFDRVGAGFASHAWRDLANPAVLRLRSRGVPVLAWTIRSLAEEAEARRGADNITFEGYRAPLPD